MDYDFNMKQLLADFDNNPDELMDHFTAALDAEIAAQKAANAPDPDANIKMAATDVANLWNEYINYYHLQKFGPDALVSNKLTATPEMVVALTDFILAYLSK